MYPYAYANGHRRGSPSSEFNENNRKYRFCCCHASNLSLVLTAFTLLFCMASVGLCLAGIFIPNSHQYLHNRHINLEYESQPETFRLFYRITLGILLTGSSIHLLTSILCLIGIRRVRPNFLVPELIVTGLFVGLILFATISITICMIILLGFLWFLTVADGLLVLYATFHFYTLLMTYRYVKDKRRAWREAANPRSHNQPQSYSHYGAGYGKAVYFSDY